MDNHKQPTDQLSRREYREQLARQQRSDRNLATEGEPPLDGNDRRRYADQAQRQPVEAKVASLKRKLNVAIVGLVVAIIIVYLILFYVG